MASGKKKSQLILYPEQLFLSKALAVNLGNSDYYYCKIVLKGKSEYSDWFSIGQYGFCYVDRKETVDMQLWCLSAKQ